MCNIIKPTANCQLRFSVFSLFNTSDFVDHFITTHIPKNLSSGETEISYVNLNGTVEATYPWNSQENFLIDTPLLIAIKEMIQLKFLLVVRVVPKLNYIGWDLYSIGMDSKAIGANSVLYANIRLSSWKRGIGGHDVPDKIVLIKSSRDLKQFLVTPIEEWQFSFKVMNNEIAEKFTKDEMVSVEVKFIV